MAKIKAFASSPNNKKAVKRKVNVISSKKKKKAVKKKIKIVRRKK